VGGLFSRLERSGLLHFLAREGGEGGEENKILLRVGKENDSLDLRGLRKKRATQHEYYDKRRGKKKGGEKKGPIYLFEEGGKKNALLILPGKLRRQKV